MTGKAEPGEGILAHPTGARSLRVREAVLRATRDLLWEGGLPAATVDAISARSGVSKATVYKHWPTKTAVAAEAFGRHMAETVPLPDTGTARGDLAEHVRQVSAFYASPAGAVFAQLLAACVTDPEGAPYFRAYFLHGRREAAGTLWERAVRQGEADPSVDVETAIDVLFGPLIFRLMSGHMELTPGEADAISAAALDGLLRHG
ncbi:TetR family transcriptional regulator [Planotetraspora thailandica]|uniref:TetR family transcriptional regulator n=1 Tax=Planotetraspora thailandica TaxID=487172 RepID=A0A8J3UXA0_9ACTN|nr:TetR/AcrR family transcriptional regulator [Planotetraspora thailandica]GII52345.1 TetR family transcriptional regulator [Planotetraspora thailandica]